MKKFFLSFAFAILAIASAFAGNETLQVATADFWGIETAPESGKGVDLTTADESTLEVTQGDVTLSLDKAGATTNFRLWNQGGTLQFRTYKNSTMTIEAGGENITAINIVGTGFATSFTANAGELTSSASEANWTGSATSVVITTAVNAKIFSIEVVYGGSTPVVTVATPVINGTTPFEDETEVTISCSTSGASIYYTLDGSDPSNQSTEYTGAFDLNATTTVKAIAYLDGTASSIATKEFVAKQVANVANVAEFNALADGTEFKFTGRLVVSAQTGKYLYAQDATGGMLLFGDAPAYSSQDVIPAGFKGTKTTFKGAPEATGMTGMEAATETQEIEAKVLKVTEVANNPFIAAVIENVLIDTDAKTFVTDDGEVAYYDRFKVEFPTDGEFYTVAGVTGYYDVPQFMPLAFEKVEPAQAKIIGVSIKGQEVEMEEGVEFAFLDLTEAFTAEDVFVTTMNADDCTVVVDVIDGWLDATNDYTVQISLLDKAGEIVDRFDVFVTVTTEDPITGINDINAASANVVKMIENGQVVIVKGDKKFNVAGQTVK
ncbi:MAG: chitobiase/beta-hexosaminidase C-terminal domain-containing protein [Bacteroidales bacterium]|nr:chitobiase/beta-hexosaminidase C-terminal domain-containing protein [Candidatus Sodaliphilus limicaballi]